MRSRITFQQILLAVAPHNIQTLENEACTAGALAAIYPENEDVFRAIESGAIGQIFHILTDIANAERELAEVEGGGPLTGGKQRIYRPVSGLSQLRRHTEGTKRQRCNKRQVLLLGSSPGQDPIDRFSRPIVGNRVLGQETTRSKSTKGLRLK